MDVHVPLAITRGLRRRGVDVLTSQEDGTARFADADLLDRARALGRLLFTMDRTFLMEAARRQQAGTVFATVIYVHALCINIGGCVDDLHLIVGAPNAAEMISNVVYLPL